MSKESERYCPKCDEVISIDKFNFYPDANTYSKNCRSCMRKPSKEVHIFKNGKLNTKQPRGFNWILGYSLNDYRK